MASSPFSEALKRPSTRIGGLAFVVVVVVWLVAFFLPQGSKLTALQAKEVSLRQAVAQDDAKIAKLRDESQHTAQIGLMFNSLSAYAPATEDIYTYIQTLSGAGRAAGVSITSIAPGLPAPMAHTAYSAIPIATSVKGTYDALLAFVHALDALPRLTDINTMAISGGGPSTNRAATLTVAFGLSIFTTAKPASG